MKRGRKVRPFTFTTNETGCHLCDSHKPEVKGQMVKTKHCEFVLRGCIPIKRDGRTIYAQQVVWEEVHGEVPLGQFIWQVCGNPTCINIEHMEMMTR